MNKRQEALRAVKFALFSVSAGLIQIGSFTLFNEIFHWSYWVCYLLSLVLIALAGAGLIRSRRRGHAYRICSRQVY